MSPRTPRGVAFAAALVVLASLLASCGDATSSSKSSSDKKSCVSNATTTTGKPLAEGDDIAGVVAARKAPEVLFPDPLPTKLVVSDLIEGTGAPLEASDEATLQYVGVMAKDCSTFDSTWSKGQPATFTIAQLIKGWQEGLVGMKPGGRRMLIIPPDLAYGEKPSQAGAPSGTLGFVVDLISIGPKADPAVMEAVTARGKPALTAPSPLPTTVTQTDDVIGTGAAIGEGTKTAIVMIVAEQLPSAQTDSTWESGTPERFELARLNPDLKQALMGMKVGGRRTVVLPPSSTTATAPGEQPQTVVAVLDLVGVG